MQRPILDEDVPVIVGGGARVADVTAMMRRAAIASKSWREIVMGDFVAIRRGGMAVFQGDFGGEGRWLRILEKCCRIAGKAGVGLRRDRGASG